MPSLPGCELSATDRLSTPPLVQTAWLAERLGEPSVRILDASWYLPAAERDARAEFEAAHIPGAVYFDLDLASDPASPLPHMLPTTERFASVMRSLGVRDSDTVVVYDGSGNNLSAPRAWWMLRVFGHSDVALLDGGLARWKTEGRPLDGGFPSPPAGDFTARLDASRVVTAEQVESAVRSGSAQVVDARSAARFAGSAPEPRAGLRGGHIPRSRTVPFSELVRADGTMLRGAELAGVFERAGVDLRRPVIATCGSGVTACALLHALHTLGLDDVFLYDGSWTEWGARSDLPVETGFPPPA